jgi:hypothetical protein
LEKKTNEQVAAVVENEGLDYAITSYMSASTIEDPELADLWSQAADILGQIEDKLSPYM